VSKSLLELAVGDDERGCTYNTPKLENASYSIVTSRTMCCPLNSFSHYHHEKIQDDYDHDAEPTDHNL
jgi:hypothetical protein